MRLRDLPHEPADCEPDRKPAGDDTDEPQTACHNENVPLIAAITATRNATSAVASLTRLSPSMITTRRRGTPSRLEIAVAAIGSVGETTAPSTNDAAQLMPTANVRDDRDGDDRHQHEPEREQADRPGVRPEVAERREERGRVEERRQHADQARAPATG